MSADPVILKILTGMQAGVEVALAEGTYTVGSGTDDDIQLVDVSLLASHLRLRIGAGKAEVAAQAGAVQLGSGTTLMADQGWHGLEPLEAATAGTTRFALGPKSANWASVAEDGRRSAAPTPSNAAEDRQTPPPSPAGRLRTLAVPLLGLIVVIVLGAWYALTGGHLPSTMANHADDLRTVRAALDAFPFGAPIEARQEVDGAIYVSGYVETAVERRALAGAIDRTGTPVHLRLFVLDDVRREVKALIAAEKLPVTSTVSDKGLVTLDGLVLQPAREHKLVAEVRETVLGVSGVASHIRTAGTLIEAVRQLVADAQLKPWLLLRLDGDVIEVSGALPSDKVDAWVGFLQTYASRFADEIALRSFVQLQAPNGRLTPAPGVSGALAVGPNPAVPGDTVVDVERLRRGDFSLGDIFVGERGNGDQRDRASNLSAPAARLSADAARRDRAPAPGSSGTAAALATLSPVRGGGIPNAPGLGRPDFPARAVGAGAVADATGTPGADGRTARRPMVDAPARDGTVPGSAEPGRPGGGDVLAGPSHAETGASGVEGRTPASGRTGAAGVAAPSPQPYTEASAARGWTAADTSHGAGADSPAGAPTGPGADSRPIPGAAGIGARGTLPPSEAASAPGLAGRTASGDAASAPGLAGRTASGDAVALDPRSTRSEVLSTAGGDVATNPSPAGAAPGSATAATGSALPPSAPDAYGPDAGLARAGAAQAAAAPGAVAPSVVVQTAPEQLTAGQDVGAARAIGGLADRAAQALKRFRNGKPGQDDADRAIDEAVALIESRGNGATSPGAGQPPSAGWYLPLFVDRRAPRPGTAPCWAGTALTADDLLPVLFWLDVMSASRRITLAAFDQAQQSLLIEAALDPREVAACGRRSPAAGAATDHSLYLREVSRNPGFVAFVLRDLPTAELDVAGASLGRRRFVITGAGDRMAEGAAPDRSSRLAVVGELGLALQREDGLSVMVFGPGISWTVTE